MPAQADALEGRYAGMNMTSDYVDKINTALYGAIRDFTRGREYSDRTAAIDRVMTAQSNMTDAIQTLRANYAAEPSAGQSVRFLGNLAIYNILIGNFISAFSHIDVARHILSNQFYLGYVPPAQHEMYVQQIERTTTHIFALGLARGLDRKPVTRQMRRRIARWLIQ